MPAPTASRAAARARSSERELGEMGAAIAALQQLEPRGLGARNAIEALLLAARSA